MTKLYASSENKEDCSFIEEGGEVLRGCYKQKYTRINQEFEV